MNYETPSASGAAFLAFLQDLDQCGITYSGSHRYSLRSSSRPFIHVTESADLFYGLRGGRLVSIKDVPSGLSADCLCPECRQPLVAKKGAIKIHHFAHYAVPSGSTRTKTDNLVACTGGPETVVHKMAKQLIQERRSLVLPPVFVQCEYQWIDRTLVESEQSSQAPVAVSFRDVALESRIGNITPDILATLDGANGFAGERIAIEIAVTHFCDETKKTLIRKAGLRCVEIDLSGFAFEPGAPVSDFQDRLWCYLTDPARITWIYSPRALDVGHKVLAKLQSTIKRLEEEKQKWLAEQEKQKQLAEMERERRLAEMEAEREFCHRFSEFVQRHRDRWSDFKAKDSPVIGPRLNDIMELMETFVRSGIANQPEGPGDWAFSCSPAVWQSLLIFLLLEHFSGQAISTQLAADLLQKNGIVITTHFEGRPVNRRTKIDNEDWVHHFAVIGRFLNGCPFFEAAKRDYHWIVDTNHDVRVYENVAPTLWARLCREEEARKTRQLMEEEARKTAQLIEQRTDRFVAFINRQRQQWLRQRDFPFLVDAIARYHLDEFLEKANNLRGTWGIGCSPDVWQALLICEMGKKKAFQPFSFADIKQIFSNYIINVTCEFEGETVSLGIDHCEAVDPWSAVQTFLAECPLFTEEKSDDGSPVWRSKSIDDRKDMGDNDGNISFDPFDDPN